MVEAAGIEPTAIILKIIINQTYYHLQCLFSRSAAVLLGVLQMLHFASIVYYLFKPLC